MRKIVLLVEYSKMAFVFSNQMKIWKVKLWSPGSNQLWRKMHNVTELIDMKVTFIYNSSLPASNSCYSV